MSLTETTNWIPRTQEIQELEKIKFSYDLRKNPDDFNRYVSERIDRISNETMDKKRAAFQKAHTDMGRYFDMDHNANFYKIRNNDVVNLQDQMLQRSRAAFQGIRHDKDLTRRQAEINEWYFNDKLETLFFLQIFFVVVLSMAIVTYLQKNGYITSQFAVYLTAILFFVVIGTGLYRNRYTNEFRDARFWSKRNFREREAVVTSTEQDQCGAPGDGSFVPKGVSDCANKAARNALQASGSALLYAEDSAKPYGQIALGAAGAMGTGLGAAAVAPVVGAGLLIGQGLSDSKSVANKAGAAAARAESQLTLDTLAYITGDGRPKPDPNAQATCPF